MGLNIPLISGLPTPPTRTDPTNFAERADQFLSALPNFGEQLNAVISELNKITSGLDQQEPISAYNSLTTYSFPDVVACTDGYSYRCVDTNVIGIDPMTDNGTKWVPLAKPVYVDRLINLGNAGLSRTLDTTLYDSFILVCDNFTLDLSSTTIEIGRTITITLVWASLCTITWPAGTRWPGGSPPSFSTGWDKVVMQRISPTYILASLAGSNYA